jgi:hypothetical protein
MACYWGVRSEVRSAEARCPDVFRPREAALRAPFARLGYGAEQDGSF